MGRSLRAGGVAGAQVLAVALALALASSAQAGAGAAPTAAAAPGAHAGAPLKTLRYAFPVAETSFDPAQISDLYSRTVAAGIFDAPLEFAYLTRPVRLRPNTAAAMLFSSRRRHT